MALMTRPKTTPVTVSPDISVLQCVVLPTSGMKVQVRYQARIAACSNVA